MGDTNDTGILKVLVHSLWTDFERLKSHVPELEARKVELRALLAQTSANSHKPPSSGSYKKIPFIKTALPKLSQKRPGGQAGHPGQTLKTVKQRYLIHRHLATHYSQCRLALAGEGHLVARQQVFDLPRLWAEAYQLMAHQCSCGYGQTSQFPAHVTTPVYYGLRIQVQSLLLNEEYRTSFAKANRLWEDVTSYAYNPTTLVTAKVFAFERLVLIELQLKVQLNKTPVCYFDETGISLGETLYWLHAVCSTEYIHLYFHPKRGQDSLCSAQNISVLEDCHNWTVYECWASYFTGRHGLCVGYWLREPQAFIDQGRQWASALRTYLLKAYQVTRCGHIAAYVQPQWLAEYDQLCQQEDQEELSALVFFKANGLMCRANRSKGRNPLERLVLQRQAVLAFAFEQGVPFTNNQAKHDLRPARVNKKVSNCFRMLADIASYARILGFISIIRKNKPNVINRPIGLPSKRYHFLD